jgi:naringenin degradation protein FdeH
MTINQMRPIRRVVTGNDAQGRSRVLYDSAAPNVVPRPENPRAGMTDLWVYKQSPAPIGGERDDGALPYHFEPPPAGGHLRIVQSTKPPPGYELTKDPAYVPFHEPKVREDGVLVRGGQSSHTSAMHKSETVDYGIALSGERVLVLDTKTLVMKPGDVVVQLGNWHLWSSERSDVSMAFVMMGATFG